MTESRELWRTIERELLRAQDLETVVLKSHLLVETQINTALERRLGPEIDNARLSFHQKLEVLACIWPGLKRKSGPIGPRSLYEDWKELNKLRNTIAHQLSSASMRISLVGWVTRTLGYKLKTINRTVVLKRNIVKATVFKLAFFSGITCEWSTCSNWQKVSR